MCIKNFGYISGLTLNINKTEGILIGNLKDIIYNELHGVKFNKVAPKSQEFTSVITLKSVKRKIGEIKSKNWKDFLNHGKKEN